LGDAFVYVDGFNFYYGVVKGTGYKWLNIESLIVAMLPDHSVRRIVYGTAPTKPVPWDADVQVRQKAYLDALGTLPLVEIVKGTYMQKPTRMPLLNPSKMDQPCEPGDYPRVHVLKHEEKGTDVTLGARMVYDACTESSFDVAVIVTNDSDLYEPVRLLRQKLGKRVEQIVPTRPPLHKYEGRKSVYRGKVDQIYHEINVSALRAHQFPDPVERANGSLIAKPASW
jgi:hypothetical protein